jgi:hypothetical protein
MSTDGRLRRLFPALSAHERGMLALEASKAGHKPDVVIYTTMPSAQARAFNRMTNVINAINIELAAVIFVLREQVKQIDLRYNWMLTLVLCGDQAAKFAETVRASTKDRRLRAAAKKLVEGLPGSLETPVDLSLSESEDEVLERDGFANALVRMLLVTIKKDLEQHWAELRGIEIVIGEYQDAEFDGEDPIREDTREMIEFSKARCVRVHEAIQDYVVPFDLPEPDEDEISLVRTLIEKVAAS